MRQTAAAANMLSIIALIFRSCVTAVLPEPLGRDTPMCNMTEPQVTQLVEGLGAAAYLTQLKLLPGLDGPGLCQVLQQAAGVHADGQYLWADTALGYPGVDPSAPPETWTLAQILTDFGSYCFRELRLEAYILLHLTAARLVGSGGACFHQRMYGRVFMGSSKLRKNVLGNLGADGLTQLAVFLQDMAANLELEKEWRDTSGYALGQALFNLGLHNEAREAYRAVIRVGAQPGSRGGSVGGEEAQEAEQETDGDEGGAPDKDCIEQPAAESGQPHGDSDWVGDQEEGVMILTVATHARPTLGHLLSSLEMATQAPTGLQVACFGAHFGDFMLKVSCLQGVVRSYPPGQLVLFTDAYDSLAFPAIKDIVKTYKAMGAPIVFAAESFCNPDEGLILLAQDAAQARKERGVQDGPFLCLNSGQFMGRAGDVAAMLDEVAGYRSGCATYNDQRGFTQFFLEHPEIASLDTRGELFLCLESLPPEWFHYDSNTGVLHCSHTNTTPAIGHGNGDTGKMRYALLAHTVLGARMEPVALSLGQHILSNLDLESVRRDGPVGSAWHNLKLAEALFESADATHPGDPRVVAGLAGIQTHLALAARPEETTDRQ